MTITVIIIATVVSLSVCTWMVCRTVQQVTALVDQAVTRLESRKMPPLEQKINTTVECLNYLADRFRGNRADWSTFPPDVQAAIQQWASHVERAAQFKRNARSPDFNSGSGRPKPLYTKGVLIRGGRAPSEGVNQNGS